MVMAEVERVQGVESVERVEFFPVDPVTLRRDPNKRTGQVELPNGALFLSFRHRVIVV